jgi:hypothetical protein
MLAVKARVRNGRLVLDESTDLPEGTEVDLVAVDADDSLDEAERAALHAAIAEGLAEADRGDTVDAEYVLAQLRGHAS